MGHGGGIINRNLTLAVITLLALVLFVNVSAVSAANTTTVDADSIIKSSDTVKNYVETKKTVPSTVTVGTKKVTSEQYMDLLTSTVTNLNKNTKKSVTVKTVSKAPKPVENVKTGTLSKSEYVTLAGKITAFVNTYGRLPNFISTSKGTMNPNNLIYTYSKIVAFYKTNNRLPNTVSVAPWKTTSGEGAPSTVSGSTQAKIDAIGYKEATFRRAQGNSNPTTMEKIGWGDCWASSSWLYNKLSAIGVKVRIVQCVGGSYPLHRWAQINTGNGWVTWNYAKYKSQHIGAIGGYYVVKTYTG